MLALSVLHLGGFGLGYWVSKWLVGGHRREDISIYRTISIEVGMQNSGLGAALAKAHFSNPLTAVPCAISATMHSIYGSLIAGYWRWNNRRGK
ncbi:Probable sodium/metabolite cotransporter BASS1, chloroplastic [Galdieria sulphuraria]|nr:Probable sodium/metabolite cotransporter BASS1, chloroplastic [Galdieria sulphuraria]